MKLIRRENQYPVWPNLWNEFFQTNAMDWSNRNYSNTQTTLPSVNIREHADGFEVEMAAPGMKKEDFKIQLNHSVLTIESERKDEAEVKEQWYNRKEFSYQSFCRSFRLSDVVDGDKIEARYENGILRVTLPKREELKPRPARQIDVA